MSSGGILLALCLLVLLSIAGSAFAHVSQERRARQAQKIKQMQQSARQLSEAAHAIDPWCPLRSIPAELAGMGVRAWREVLQLDPQSPHAQTELAGIETLARALAGGKQAGSGPMNLATNQEISNVQRHLRNAEAIFHRLLETGSLDDATYRQYAMEIRWLILRAEVDSLLHQGNLAMERKDRVRFNSFCQRALNQLKKSSLADPRRNDYIKIISDKLADRDEPRQALNASP